MQAASGCGTLSAPVLPARTEAVIATLGRPIAERPRRQTFIDAPATPPADALAGSRIGVAHMEPFAALAEASAWERLVQRLRWSPSRAAVGTGWNARPAPLHAAPAPGDALLAHNTGGPRVFPAAHVDTGFEPGHRIDVFDRPPGAGVRPPGGVDPLPPPILQPPTAPVLSPPPTPSVPPVLPGEIRTRPIVIGPAVAPQLPASTDRKPLESPPTSERPRIVLEVYDILDPAPAASELQYLIRVTNGDTAAIDAVRLRFDCPQNLQPLALADLKATVKAGVVTSEPFSLAAGECRSFRLKVRTLAKGETVLRVAVLDAGDAVLRAEEEKTQITE